MKAVIFAGGVGTRLWPLSRKKSPKQFEKMINDKSTLQLTIDLLRPEFDLNDIYIATGKEYVDLVHKQLSNIPLGNIIGEPHRKDVGPAVAMVMGLLSKKFPDEPVVVLWSDHWIRKNDKFKKILSAAEAYLQEHPQRMVYFGHKPRFASENLGWIETSQVKEKSEGVNLNGFVGFKYRPDIETAKKYFSERRFCWNLGSFASTPGFLYGLFKEFAPEVYNLVEKILAQQDAPDFDTTFEKLYEQMPSIHLDNAISERIKPEFARVIVDDIGWSDVGAWEALKEALQKTDTDNVTLGRVLLEECADALVYNYESKKLLVAIDIEEGLIINTPDVLLITKKTSVAKVKKLVESFEGTEHEGLT